MNKMFNPHSSILPFCVRDRLRDTRKRPEDQLPAVYGLLTSTSSRKLCSVANATSLYLKNAKKLSG